MSILRICLFIAFAILSVAALPEDFTHKDTNKVATKQPLANTLHQVATTQPLANTLHTHKPTHQAVTRPPLANTKKCKLCMGMYHQRHADPVSNWFKLHSDYSIYLYTSRL
ncbi:hypothetical protein M8J77_011238 [Diaphorina citri]|nr:hypothetical protein M8J77_011238 [Diaphorina citri]